jgi:Fungal specific transcription factor domain
MLDLLTNSLSCRVDVAGGTLSQSKPRFPPIRHLCTSMPRSSIHDHPISIAGSRFRALAHSLSISHDLANVLEDMSYLTTFVEVPHHESTMTEDITYFDDQRASIEDRILKMAGEEEKAEGNTENIQEPCRLVALIYTNMVFRELQPSAATHTFLTSRLRTALNETHLMSCWGNPSETLLWVLFMGGAIALREPVRSWFVSVLSMVCTQLKIQSWHDIKDILVKYLWCDRIWEVRCKNLWFQVEEHRDCTS